jgi:molecular chaperone DnaK
VRDESGSAIGFDFGTSTTLIAAGDDLVWIGTTDPWMPSLVGYDDDGDVVVGEAADSAESSRVIRSIKRAITQRRTYARVDAPDGLRDQRADDLMVEVLRGAAKRAAAKGVDVFDRARLWLGCPAMWDGRQRRRLLDVAHRAGLPVTLASLIDEPVAAGIAWLAAQAPAAAEPLRVLVFDMGGGTLDIAVLDVRGGDHREVSVLAAVGLAEAGDALDDEIADDLDHALAAAGTDVDALPWPEEARELLVDAARTLKVGLSTEEEFVVVLPPDVFGPNEIWYRRVQLNAVFAAQLDRAEEYLAGALRAARLTGLDPGSAYDIARAPVETLVEGVDVVLLSGGMSQVPYVGQRLRELFGPGTRIEPASTPPQHAVALGLAGAGKFGRINMFRPAFDVLVEWDSGRESRTLYEAYLPLVESWQIARGGSDLRFICAGRDLSLPVDGKGRLRVVSHSGGPVGASLGGGSLDGFAVAFDGENFELSLYPSGRIRLVDGAGTHEGQVDDWYPMRPA